MIEAISQAKRLMRRIACRALSPRLYYSIFFRRRHGYWPRLSCPRTFNEKVLWHFLYADLEVLSPYADKAAVREYVASRVGPHVLVPLIDIFSDISEVKRLRELPPNFVAKAAQGSHMILFVRDGKGVTDEEFQKTCRRWLKCDFAEITGERVYSRVPKRIIIEELLIREYEQLLDYKFLCYNGVPRWIDVHGGRFTDHREDIYSVEWERLPARKGARNFRERLPAPENLKEMLDVARTLAQPFSFVRVDLYSVLGKIYFGELTFLPAAARTPITPIKYEYLLGEEFPVQRNMLLTPIESAAAVFNERGP